jgi:hypothetical protein
MNQRTKTNTKCVNINGDSSGNNGNSGKKPMLIANPIYDVVFKYLLDDNKIAKKLLSLIIGKEIITLDYKPTEIRNDTHKKPISLLHIDFSALVKLEDGSEQQIIIELQKAKWYVDILRFRRYLGTQYADPKNIYFKNDRNTAMPIFSIYFLGHCLKHVKVPVIKVDRTYIDAATGEELSAKEEFIEGLTHDSMVIQIPALKSHRRNLLEKVLSVFKPSSGENQMIDVSEEDYPEEYGEVIRRLLRAGAEKDIRETMILEDGAIADLDNMARTIVEKDQALEEKDEVIENKDLALEEKDQVIEKKDLALEEKTQQLENAAKILAKSMGISIEEARKMLYK